MEASDKRKPKHSSSAIDAYDEHSKYSLQVDSIIGLLLCDEQYKNVSNGVLSGAIWLIEDLNRKMEASFETLYEEAKD